MRRIFCVFALIIIITANTAFAETVLPDGSVQGLPQNLFVFDENGYSPDPDNGELYIYIDNMIPNEIYTKDITLMNGRSDAVYSIYMTATPNYSDGNVDLLAETVCKLYLDDKLIYEGLVDGSGKPNMQSNGLDLGGVLKSGETRKLHAEFQWVTNMDWDNSESSYYGVVSFHWTFFAAVPASSSNGSGGGGGGSSNPSRPGIMIIPGGSTPTASPVPGTPNVPGSENYDNPDNPSDPNTPDNPDNPNNPDNPSNPDTPDSAGSADGGSGWSTPPPVDSSWNSGGTNVIDRIVDNLPIPENVKTGYRSQVKLLVVVALAAFLLAALLLVIVIIKTIKLKRLKRAQRG